MKQMKICALAMAILMTVAFAIGCTGTVVTEEPQQSSDQTATQAPETTGEQPAQSTAPAAEQDDTIVYAMWNSPSGVLNPLLVDDEYDGAILKFTFDTLLKYDKELNLVPNMAESYEMSDDQLTLVFKLRQNIKWHDGEPVTAADVAFTFNSMADPNYTGPRYGDVEGLKGAAAYHNGEADHIEGITVVDDYTIKFEFERPYAPGLSKIGADRAIIPEHIWSKVPIGEWANQTELMNKPIGCGPYVLDTFVPGQYVELHAFEDYYNGVAKTPKIIFKVSNQDTVIAELTNGEIDIADISSLKSQDIQTLQDNGINITSYTGVTSQYMGFNLREEIFQDKRVRQAITYAIDRKLMVEKLLEGRATIIDAPLLPSSWAYPEAGVLNDYAYDLDKAKALLAEAGWEDRNNDGIVENAAGEPFKVTLKYPIGNKIREQSAPIIQANLKQIGIDVELEIMEFAALLDEVMANHEFDMYLMGSSLDTDPDPKPIWHSDAASDEKGNSGWNIIGFRNAEADKLMEDALKTTNVEERKALYKDFCILVNEEAAEVLLYAPQVIKAYSSKLHNYDPSTFNDYYQLTEWYIDK